MIKILDENVAYVRIADLTATRVMSEVKELLTNLPRRARSIIIDLRDNGGGAISNCVGLANAFLDKPGQVIVSTIDSNGYLNKQLSTGNCIVPQIPIFILINEGTRAGSLILAAALQENGRATVIGEQSKSNDLIQALNKLDDGTAIQVSYARWLTPGEHSVRRDGVRPDIVVHVTAGERFFRKGPWWYQEAFMDVNALRDKQLIWAVKLAKQLSQKP